MDHTYWLKQSEKSLFPDILWSRPESKAGAGKLLIVGGNLHGFSAPGNAYNESLEAGAGVVRVVMPDALRKIVKFLLPDADYAPSTPSGSFAKSALDILLSSAQWSDCTLIAGDVGRNSETAMLLESFVKHYAGILVITRDAADYFRESPQAVIDREKNASGRQLGTTAKNIYSYANNYPDNLLYVEPATCRSTLHIHA
jgi:NAD(P)H-hydrate repair Nnr-like enzyme with NAD(P)H-hydrate dehydratase domain